MGVFQQLVQDVAWYLQGKLSAGDLRRSVSVLSWGIGAWGSQREAELAGSIDLALSEFEAGHLTEDELREELLRHCMLTTFEDTGVVSGSSVTRVPAPAWSPWAGRQSGVESGLSVGPQA